MKQINAFIHPEDEAAMKAMKAIPGFDLLTKKIMSYGFESMLYGINMASKIRLSKTQMPDLYDRLVGICGKLEIEVPEMYLEMNPYPNAYTYGDTRVCLVVTSGLLEYLKPDEVDSVIAHECGHILCHHVLYHTMASFLALGSDVLGLLGAWTEPVWYAMLYWQRKSELSADRVGAIVTDIDTVVRTQLRLAGGPETLTGQINIEEWASQADRYEEIRSGKTWNKILQTVATLNQTHPFAAVRVREIMKWEKGGGYDKAMKMMFKEKEENRCPRCGEDVDDSWMFCKYCGMKLK